MSYPRWPQSAFFYRPRTVPTSSPYGEYVPGFGSFGPKTQGLTYGSLSPKYDWATPRYIRAEPTGLDDFGDFGLNAVEQGCLADVRKMASEALFSVLNNVSGGVADSKVGIGPFAVDIGAMLRGKINESLNGIENALLGRMEQDWPTIQQVIVEFVMNALPNIKTGHDMIDKFIDPGTIGQAFAEALKTRLDDCARAQGVIPTVMEPITVTPTAAPLAQAYLVTSRFLQPAPTKVVAKPQILTSRFIPKTTAQAATSPIIPLAIGAAALFLLMRK